jgi:malonate transporter
MFVVISRTSLAGILANGPLLGILLLGMAAAYALVLWLDRRFSGVDTGTASVQALTVCLPNYAAVGLPLLGRVYGPASATGVTAAVALAAVTVSPLTLVLLAGAAGRDSGPASGRFLRTLGRTVRRPIVWAPFAGMAVAASGLPVPEMAGRAFDLLGQATIGVALFLTGIILSSFRLSMDRTVLAGVLVKNLAQPAGVYLAVRALGLGAPAAGQAVLLMALPAGFSGVVFGADMDVRHEAAGATMVWSSLLSLGTLAAALLAVAPR